MFPQKRPRLSVHGSCAVSSSNGSPVYLTDNAATDSDGAPVYLSDDESVTQSGVSIYSHSDSVSVVIGSPLSNKAMSPAPVKKDTERDEESCLGLDESPLPAKDW